jgi:SPP1 family predicted phage head-tail adaptor
VRLKAGDLRHQILIRRPIEVDNGKGAYTTTLSTIAEPWAEVKGLTGREAVMDQVLQSISVYRIRIRWRDDIKTADQIRHGTIDLNITSADDPDGSREQLIIIADTAGVRVDLP